MERDTLPTQDRKTQDRDSTTSTKKSKKRKPVTPTVNIEPFAVSDDQIPHLFAGMSARTADRMSAKGEFPPKIRLSDGRRARDYGALRAWWKARKQEGSDK